MTFELSQDMLSKKEEKGKPCSQEKVDLELPLKKIAVTSLAVQRLRLHASTAGKCMGSIPKVEELKISHAVQ